MKFMISLLGWFLWNWVELTIKKSELDDDGNPQTNFSFYDFKSKKWTFWIGSLACIPLLLWLGYSKLGLDPFESVLGGHLGWSDAYYLLPGAAFEALIFAVKWVHKYFKKRSES